MPSLAEANARERILVLPWTEEKPMEIGELPLAGWHGRACVVTSSVIIECNSSPSDPILCCRDCPSGVRVSEAFSCPDELRHSMSVFKVGSALRSIKS